MNEDAAARDSELRRLRWQCRRGMLELDHLLLNFLEHGHARLDAAEQAGFRALLGAPDPQLSDWLLARSVPDDPVWQALIARIREQAHQSLAPDRGTQPNAPD